MFAEIRAARARTIAARRDRRELARDIAAYNSPADRLDLEAILDRHPDEDTVFIRSLLSHRA
jgi:hypothetical protein